MASEPQFMYVTTTGRKTGSPHEIEIWFVAHEGSYYFVSEYPDRSDTVRNIAANPAVTVKIGDRGAPVISAIGRALDRAAEPELAAAVAAKMDAKYKWSDGLIVELKPSSL